jgi:hypothetical protein
MSVCAGGGLRVEMEINPKSVASCGIGDGVETAVCDLSESINQTWEMTCTT